MSEIKKWKAKKVKLADVKPMENNARSITTEAINALRNSVARFGYVEPIVWNKTTGHIVGGHQKYSILVENGVKEATVMVVEMTAEEELAANITLNNPEIQGEWDDTAADLMGQVETAVPELYSSLRIDELRKSLDVPVVKNNEEESEDTSDKPDTKCPCCGFEWKIGASNVSVKEESGKEEI